MEREALAAHGYAVRKLVFREPEPQLYTDPPEVYDPKPYRRRLPKVETVARHPTFEAAHADATERDLSVWRAPGFDPFRYAGPLAFLSSLPDDIFRDWLLDRGVDPPDGAETWNEWYARVKPDPVGLRDGLDRLRFYDAVPARPVVYAVVEINWTWNDDPVLNADSEGGNVLKAYRRRESAEAECFEVGEVDAGEDGA